MLKSEQVFLSPISLEDLPSLFAWINDRDLVIFNSPYKPISQTQHQAWFDSLQKRSDLFIFGIRRLEENTLIGSCQLHAIHPIHRSAELQIRIGEPSERGRGYGTQAVKLLLNFAFQDLNLNRVQLSVFETNLAAINAYEKAGFQAEGVLRQAAYIDGQYVNIKMMGILRKDHEQS